MATTQQPEETQTQEEQEPTESTALMPVSQEDDATGSIDVFASHQKFRAAARMANALSQSTIVPKEYQGKVANCLVAMELASRTGASVLMVMQNLFLVSGRPGWSSAFLIASVNTSGKFSEIEYQTEGGDDPAKKMYKVRAHATKLSTGRVLYGEWITWAMVDAEGWSKKTGSKWVTMPGQMFRYRAAAFWVRAYAPEIALGMQTAEEVADVVEAAAPSSGTNDLNAALRQARAATATVVKPTADVVDAETGEVLEEAPAKAKDSEEDILAADRDLWNRENRK